MSKLTGPTNSVLKGTIVFLEKQSKENKAPVWKTVAGKISAPRRNRVEVNIDKISKYTTKKDTVVIPGKVLGHGHIDHEVTVAAPMFSKTAIKKIAAAGGKTLAIEELVSKNPSGKGVRIMG